MRPCRSEAKQLRCICSSCACETAKAFSQDSSDPLGPRDGLRPGGNRHEVLAGRRSPSRRNLAFGRGKQKLTARLTQSFWVEHMVSLRALSFCDDQPCRRRGGRVWGGGRLPYVVEACRRLLVELKLATLTEAGQLFCLVFENVPLLVQTQGPLRQSHPYDWRSKKSVADRGDWASDFDAQGPNFVLLPATLSQLLLAFLCLHPASHAKPSQLGTQNVNSKNVNSTQRKEVRNMIA